MGTTGPSPVHLLLALIHDRKNGAHRALAQCGVDVSRLRAAAMQLARGRIGPPRNHPKDQESEKRPTTAHRAAPGATHAAGVKISLPPRPTPTATTITTATAIANATSTATATSTSTSTGTPNPQRKR